MPLPLPPQRLAGAVFLPAPGASRSAAVAFGADAVAGRIATRANSLDIAGAGDHEGYAELAADLRPSVSIIASPRSAATGRDREGVDLVRDTAHAPDCALVPALEPGAR